MANYKVFFDGSCWVNPGGTAAYGFALYKEGQQEPVETGSGVIGTGPGMTNNVAEFYALDKGLGAFIRRNETSQRHMLQVYGDSNLVIQIMNRHWKPRPTGAYWADYLYAAGNLKIIRNQGHRVTFDWIPRAQNQVCDDLSKAHNK